MNTAKAKSSTPAPKKWLAACSTTLALLLLAGCSGSGGGAQRAAAGQETADAATTTAESTTAGPSSRSSRSDWPVDEVAAELEPSVVQVNVETVQTTPFGPQEAKGLGSGVIYRKDGYIITNNHVVQGANEVNVAFADGSTEKGEVVGTDPYTDLAVVKVNRDNLPAVSFAKSRNLAPGDLGGRGEPLGLPVHGNRGRHKRPQSHGTGQVNRWPTADIARRSYPDRCGHLSG